MTVYRNTFASRLAGLLLFGGLILQPAFAADPPALPEWDQLTAAQRDQLVAPIRQRWNAQPAERAQLLERAARWQQMTPDQRRHAHRGMNRWEHMSPEQRAEARALYGSMRSLEPAERAAFKAKWRAMTPEQKIAWLKAHPAPAKPRGER